MGISKMTGDQLTTTPMFILHAALSLSLSLSLGCCCIVISCNINFLILRDTPFHLQPSIHPNKWKDKSQKSITILLLTSLYMYRQLSPFHSIPIFIAVQTHGPICYCCIKIPRECRCCNSLHKRNFSYFYK